MSHLQLVSPGGERSQQFGENGLTDDTIQGQRQLGLHTEEAVTDNVCGDPWTDEIVERARNRKLQFRHFSLALRGEIVIFVIIFLLLLFTLKIS